MALIIYPTVDYDSFTTVVDSTTIITGFVQDTNTIAYLALSDPEKESVLKQTTLQIRTCPGIQLPDTSTSDLQLAQCYLAVASGISLNSVEVNNIKSNKAGSVEQSFFESNTAPPTMTPIVYSLLSQYGCKNASSSGFSQGFISN